MGISIRRTFAAYSFIWLALFLFPCIAAAQGGSVTANYCDLKSVASGAWGTAASLTSDATAPDPGYGGANYSNLTYSWTVTGAEELDVDMSASAQNPTLKAKISPSGNYKLTARVKATWDVSTGGTTSRYSDEIGFTIPVVGVEKLQSMPGATSFTDVSGTLYVLVGQSLNFQAIPTPTGVDFPDTQPVWTTASADVTISPTGATASVTFNKVSSSKTDYKTMTATCGDTWKTANIIVYDVTPILTPQDNFEGRDVDYYGVCELIDLTFSTTPSGLSVSNIGSVDWFTVDAQGFLTDNGNGTWTYECAAVAEVPYFGLWLAQQWNGKGVGKNIVPPNSHAMERTAGMGLYHKKGEQGCKVKLNNWAKSPADVKVSFGNIQVREGKSDPAEADGSYAGNDKAIHTPTEDDKGKPLWFSLAALDAKKGYKWNSIDTSGSSGPGAYADGNFKQNIYMMYRKTDDGTDGSKYAECLSTMKDEKTNGVCKIWKDPVGAFIRQCAPTDDIENLDYKDNGPLD